MHTKRLAPGERAPDGWDVIEVQKTPTGQYDVTGIVHHDRTARFGRETFSDRETAEQAGVSWAKSNDAEIVYLVTLDT